MPPIPPTLRLHYGDTYLLRFEAFVLDRRQAETGDWEIALDRSAFYVESGGQPEDHGRIAGCPVTALRLEDGVLWHRIASSAPPLPGRTVEGEVDRDRRIDHMQQHTGQHILSQSFLRAGGGGTRSFHLGAEESTIDLDGPRPDEDRLRRAQEIANGCVLDDREVRVVNVDRADLDRFPLRRDPAVERDVLRVIEIDGFDRSACGGTHARRTGEVGPIQILGVDKARAFWRIRYLAGGRALRYLAGAHRVLSEVAQANSVRWDTIPELVARLKAESLEASRELRRVRAALGERRAEDLFAAAEPDSGGVRRIGRCFRDVSPDELRALAGRLVELGSSVLLVCCPQGEQMFWIAARSPDLGGREWDAAARLREWLSTHGGKGGGKREFAQGTSPDRPGSGAIESALLEWEGCNDPAL